MLRRVAYLTVAAGLCMLVTGCAFNFLGFERRDVWRAQADRACMAQHPESYFIRQASAINGKGVCGMQYPLKVGALEDGTIGVGPDAMLNCPMTETLSAWMRDAVQPAAFAYFGMPIVEITQISSYSCRTRNNQRGAEISEHAFGNALDIAGFKLANGRVVTVKSGWYGRSDERQFLREVISTACKTFKTTLGPGAAYHSDHLHVDLAHHGKSGTYTYCNPKPPVTPPVRPPYDGSKYAAIPGQPRYDLSVAYTGSISRQEGPASPALPLPPITAPVEFPAGD